MPSEERCEGIVLRSIPYKENQKITTLFTLEFGVITLIAKGINRNNSLFSTLTTPFTLGEYHFIKGRSSLYRLVDGSIIETHLALRQSFTHIDTALSFGKAILSSQMAGKAAPLLYNLLIAYLKHLSNTSNTAPFLSSFQLKLLCHEGLLSLSPLCSCGENSATHFYLAEPYCSLHAPPGSHFFAPDEWITIFQLTQVRQFEELKSIIVPEGLQKRIGNLFKEKLAEGEFGSKDLLDKRDGPKQVTQIIHVQI